MRGTSRVLWVVGIAVLIATSAFGVGTSVATSSNRTAGSPSPGSPAPTPATPAPPTSSYNLHPHASVEMPATDWPSGMPSPRVTAPDLHLASPPPAWGPAHLPPGAPLPAVPVGASAQRFYQTWSSNGSYPLVDGTCVGKWPATGQSGYSNGCIGHDEPAINPYSDLPGSGGNVSWTVTLPTDRSPALNQSDLYIAIWFGMNLYDPYAYSGQCFLELQLYPDTAEVRSSGGGAYVSQDGTWSAYAVAWEITLSNGYEEPCYGAPLTNGRSSVPFNMAGGDRLNVTMTGWMDSPYGENISVVDEKTGVSSFLNLYNTTYHYPLDPAYLANNLEDSLPWSPGGDLPVAFSFESGHTYSGPSNDTFGGCNSGPPPPTPFNPSTPCGSYDPQSWANDTGQPWQIGPVKFFNRATWQAASQIGFEQDFGGIAWIDPLSLGTCQGRDGSAYCSYPWYSYSRATNAVEFGAADYFGTTLDFGQYLQYDSTLTTNTAALGYFPVRNFTVPALAGDSLTISFSALGLGSGTVHFLNYTLSASQTITHLPSGSYSINSVPAAGSYFSSYATSGAVTMDAAGTPWNSFRLTGTGTVTVSFSLTSPATQPVKVNVPNGAHGTVAFSPGFNLGATATYPGLIVTQSGPVTSTTVLNGGQFTGLPGMYSVQAFPSPGYNFTGWSVAGGLYIFAPHSNYTWINLTSSGGATLTANFVPTAMYETVWLETVPTAGGTITFNGTTYLSGTVLTVRDGAYPVAANARAGYSFETWSYLWSASMSHFTATTEVVLQNGSGWVYALFRSTPAVALAVAGSGSGQIAFAGTVQTGTVTLSQVEASTYPVVALPASGSFFAGWSVSNPANLSVADSTSPVTAVTVHRSGTLTATFTTGSAETIGFQAVGPGSILWNFNQLYSGSTTNSTVSPGRYSIAPAPNVQATFEGWSTEGAVTVDTLYSLNGIGEWVPRYDLNVSGAGNLTANFVNWTVPVTFVDDPSSTGTVATFTAGGVSVPIGGGTTASLRPGTYVVTVSGGLISTARWAGTSNLTLSATSGLSITVTVAGSGTLYALARSLPIVSSVVVGPPVVEPGVPFTVTATVAGGTFPFTFTFSLGVPSVGALTCSPPELYNSTTNTNSTVCTIALPSNGTYLDILNVNVTDLTKASNANTTSVEVFWPPGLTFTHPARSTELSSTANFSLEVNWTNIVPAGALPGLEQTVGLVDQVTGAYVTDTPTPTNAGLPSLWVPAAGTGSLTLGPSDLFSGPHLAPGSYSAAVGFWSTATLGSSGYPTLLLVTDYLPLTVADVQLLSPAPGSSTAAGNVTLAYALNGPGISLAELVLKNQSGPVSTTVLTLQPPTGVGSLVLPLGTGTYTATLSTFNPAANVWLNSSTNFTVVPAPVIKGPPVYNNRTSIPGYVSYVYTALLVLGTLIGLLVMWVVTRRRRGPPAQFRPLTPAGIPPAVAPGVPQGIPPGPSDWDEGPPARR
jgi:List-Bact-rpt repeat protein